MDGSDTGGQQETDSGEQDIAAHSPSSEEKSQHNHEKTVESRLSAVLGLMGRQLPPRVLPDGDRGIQDDVPDLALARRYISGFPLSQANHFQMSHRGALILEHELLTC